MTAPAGVAPQQEDIAAQIEALLDRQDASVEAPPAPPEREEAPPPEEPATEEAVEATEETPAEDAEVEVETEGESAAEEFDPIDTFDELAAHLDIDSTELQSHIQLPGRDGEMVSIAEMRDAYLAAPADDSALQAEIATARTEMRAANDTHMEALQGATMQIIQRIDNNHRSPEVMAQMRSENPGEYIRIVEEHNEQKALAEEGMAQMRAEADRRKADDEAEQVRFAEQEQQKILRMRPDWKRDPKVAEKAVADIQGYLTKTGFTQEQQDQLVDANSILTVWKAAQYDELQARKPALKKRLRKLPAKHVPVSARDEHAPRQAQEKQRNATLSRFRETGRLEDAHDLFLEHV